MRDGRALGVRGRFLLVVLLGVITPIAIVGILIARSAATSGETLLRARLDESLARAIQAIGYEWVDHRSTLLGLTEQPDVVTAMREGRDVVMAAKPSGDALRDGWAAVSDVADAAVFRDIAGTTRGTLDRGTTTDTRTPALPAIWAHFPVFEPGSSARIGSMDVRVRLSKLLPGNTLGSTIGGSAFALFDAEDGTPLLPTSLTPNEFAVDRFRRDGEEWIVERRTLAEPPLRLALAAPIGPFTEPFAQATRRGSFALAMVAALSFALATLLTRHITVPLERMAEASGAIARGALDERVGEQGPDEIRRLGKAFNSMTASLRGMVLQLSQREGVIAVGEFASSLAHEVRNPLTSIRLDLERAGEKLLADPDSANELLGRALRQVDRLDATVGGSLRIARSGNLTLTAIDLRGPLLSAMHAAAPAIEARGATAEVRHAPNDELPVEGNAGALEQMFLNLLLNAADALPVGGRIVVSVDAADAFIQVAVRDDGSGISEEALARVWEPFYSTKDEGTGLGLPIAQRIAHAHGAELTIESRFGEGTVVRIRLARASRATIVR